MCSCQSSKQMSFTDSGYPQSPWGHLGRLTVSAVAAYTGRAKIPYSVTWLKQPIQTQLQGQIPLHAKKQGRRRPKACRPWFPMNPCHSCFQCFLHHMDRPVPLVRDSRKSKKPADHRPEGIMVLLAQKYKLNSVCNADEYPPSGWFSPESPKGYAQKSITRIV